MCELTKDQIKEIYDDIIMLFETESVNSANYYLSEGARLLCISKNPPEADSAAIYILGWPEECGEPPLRVKRYGI